MERNAPSLASLRSTSGVDRGLRSAAGGAGWQAILQAGAAHHKAGRLREAQACYRQALRLAPGSFDAKHLLAVATAALGEYREARRLYRELVESHPDQAVLRSNYGNFLLRTDDTRGALLQYDKALALDPELADAYANRAGALNRLGFGEAAELSAREALAREPEHMTARLNLAGALLLQGRREEARSILEALEQEGCSAPELLLNGGILAMQEGRLAEAEERLRQLLSLSPGDLEGKKWLGIVLTHRQKLDEAEKYLEDYVRHDPEPSPALLALGHLKVVTIRCREGFEQMRRAAEREHVSPYEFSTYVFDSNYNPDLSPRQILSLHREWDRRFGHPGHVERNAPPRSADPERRIRIGLVSPDFRGHSVAFFLTPLLEGLDRERFEIFCYNNHLQPDETTLRLAELADNWRDICLRPDSEVADQVRRDGIDILVDLAGHTANNRLPLFVHRPAPLQITYLGYPNTTGLSAIDARIVDHWTDPPGSDDLATERLVRLDRCFLCYRPGPYPEISPAPFERNGFITFGSFNNFAKLSEPLLALWAEILKAVPRSRLVLKHYQSGNASIRRRLLAMFERHGVEGSRIHMLDPSSGYRSHLARYSEVDIALDTWPYSGTTTTCEALWMGVPVVTLQGDRHASRVSSSLLKEIGFTAGIATSPEDYVGTAVMLASAGEILTGLRRSLRVEMAESPLCDAFDHARHFGDALHNLWREWCTNGRIRRQESAPGNVLEAI